MTTKLEHNGPGSIVEQASRLLIERRSCEVHQRQPEGL